MSAMKETRSKAFHKIGRQRRNLFLVQRRLEILKELGYSDSELNTTLNYINSSNKAITQEDIENFELHNRASNSLDESEIDTGFSKLKDQSFETSWLIKRTQVLNQCLDEENFNGASFQIKKFYIYLSNQNVKENSRIQNFVRCGLIGKFVCMIKNYFMESKNRDLECKNLALLYF